MILKGRIVNIKLDIVRILSIKRKFKFQPHPHQLTTHNSVHLSPLLMTAWTGLNAPSHPSWTPYPNCEFCGDAATILRVIVAATSRPHQPTLQPHQLHFKLSHQPPLKLPHQPHLKPPHQPPSLQPPELP